MSLAFVLLDFQHVGVRSKTELVLECMRTVPKAPLPNTLPFFHWIVSSSWLSWVQALPDRLLRRLSRLHIVWSETGEYYLQVQTC